MGYASLILKVFEILIGYADNINLKATLGHTSAVDTCIMQRLRDDLGMLSSFYVKQSCIS